MKQANQPIHEEKLGSVKAVIWERRTEKGTAFNIDLHRIYNDPSDGTWKKTSSFGINDLPKAEKVADAAYKHLLTLKKSQADQPSHDDSPVEA